MEAKELLRNIFKADQPETATRGKTGEVIATKTATKERPEGSYLPIVAVLVGVGLMTVAALGVRRDASADRQANPQRQNRDEEETSYESDW